MRDLLLDLKQKLPQFELEFIKDHDVVYEIRYNNLNTGILVDESFTDLYTEEEYEQYLNYLVSRFLSFIQTL